VLSAEANNLEPATVENDQGLLDMHIAPFIGSTKISDLPVPMVRAFEDKLREERRSPAMVKRIGNALSTLLSDAMERGLATRNIARGLKSKSPAHPGARGPAAPEEQAKDCLSGHLRLSHRRHVGKTRTPATSAGATAESRLHLIGSRCSSAK